MAARAVRIEDEQDLDQGNALIEAVTANPVQVFTSKAAFDGLFNRMKEELADTPTTVTSKHDRDRIRSAAFKVSQTLSRIEKSRLQLTEGWRQQGAEVNDAGKRIKTDLEELRDNIRAPLDAWEEKDKQRVADCEATMTRLSAAAIIALGDTAESAKARLAEVTDTVIDPEIYQDLAEQASARREHAITVLGLAIEKLEREEADRAQAERDREELAKLRAAQAVREQEEADRAAAAKAKEEEFQRRREDADALIKHCRDCGNGVIGGQSQPFGLLLYELENKIVIPDRLADFRADIELARDTALERVRDVMARAAEDRKREEEKAEAERIAKAKADAERDAQEAAEAKVKADREEAARVAQAKIDEANERARKAEEDAAAEAKRIADEKAADAEKARIAREEQARRDADQAHRAQVIATAATAVEACGIPAVKAKAVVMAIAAGNVPAVRIQF
jgi:hypothetical protein